MTLEERKERFFKFEGCVGTACNECSYHNPENRISAMNCQDRIHEDAKMIMKEMADKPLGQFKEVDYKIYVAPLDPEEREQIRELVRVKTEVSDISAHFIQEINELCAELNILAATIGKLEQVTKGTDPVGKDDDEDALVEAVNVCVADVIAEAADVYNYLWAIGYSHKLDRFRENVDEKLARWANRLNGVSDE